MNPWIKAFEKTGLSAPLTRFAPSPTGHMHMGHAVHALYVWGITAALGGRVLLRMEDHDRQRCRPAFEQSILDDLAWLGLVPHVGSAEDLRQGESEFRQSDRESIYEGILEDLQAKGLVYGCTCSRKMVAEAAIAFPGKEPRYDGRCRDADHGWGSGAGIRLRMPDQDQAVNELAASKAPQNPAQQCGDLLIRDRRGNWTYQFCVAVDDTLQDVDLIIRGEDLLPSCGRQLALARLLGRQQDPVFLHHPLVEDVEGRKLAKRDGDAAIGWLRRQGLPGEQVLGTAAHLAGLLEEPIPLKAKDLAELFL